jgi:hypothetical protein
MIGSRLREQTGERSQVLDYRNAVLNAFATSGKRHKGKPQADAAKYHYPSQARSVRMGLRLGLKRRESRALAKSCAYPFTLCQSVRGRLSGTRNSISRRVAAAALDISVAKLMQKAGL